MRTMTHNRQKFYYEQYLGKTAITSGGYETGEYTENYGAKTEAWGNISAPNTSTRYGGCGERTYFGIAEMYDRSIVTPAPLTEETRLWIDDLTAAAPDYIVIRVAKSLNEEVVYIKKIK